MWSVAFTATLYHKIFSGNQSRQVVKRQKTKVLRTFSVLVISVPQGQGQRSASKRWFFFCLLTTAGSSRIFYIKYLLFHPWALESCFRCSQVLWWNRGDWQDWVAVSEAGTWGIQAQLVWVGCECSTILWFSSQLCSILCHLETTWPYNGAGFTTWRTVSQFWNRPVWLTAARKDVHEMLYCGGVRKWNFSVWTKPKITLFDHW